MLSVSYKYDNEQVIVQDDSDIFMAYAIAKTSNRKVKFTIEYKKI